MSISIPQGDDEEASKAALKSWISGQTPDRILRIAEAMRRGLSVEEIHTTTHWDIWFLEQIAGIVAAEAYVAGQGLPTDKAALHRLKAMGFSDARLAKLSGKSQDEVADIRTGMGITPVYKRIDTCAAEFASETAYLYSSFEDKAGAVCEAAPSSAEKVVILGGGPNRIGQGIEFDYCCVHACYALSDAGYETIMINCNPETVSTDYDTSDRLYFEPLTAGRCDLCDRA